MRVQRCTAWGVRLLVIMLFLAGSARGQFTGNIQGTVVDQSGAVIAGAKVTVTDAERGVSRALVTDSAGQYTAPSLTPGQYTVRAEATGFKAVERSNITLGVGQAVRVDLQLQPGEQNHTLTVTGEAPLIYTSIDVI